jgi:hypothetical protein
LPVKPATYGQFAGLTVTDTFCDKDPALTVTVAGELTDPDARVTVSVKGLVEPVIDAVKPDGAAATGTVVLVTDVVALDPAPVHAVSDSVVDAIVGQPAGVGENEQSVPPVPPPVGASGPSTLAKLALTKRPLASVIVSTSSTQLFARTVKPPPEFATGVPVIDTNVGRFAAMVYGGVPPYT